MIKGRILSRCSYYEQRMDLFITKHFVGDEDASFTEDVLENEFFSFELKKRIFYKLLGKHFPEYYASFPRTKFTRLQTIRNVVAHGAIVTSPDHPGEKLACLRHGAKNHSIQEILEEFDNINDEIRRIFETLPLSSEKEVEIELTGVG